MDELENIIFELIVFSGNGKSSAMEAIQEAKKGDFLKAEESLKDASEQLGKAHKYQTSLIQAEAAGKSTTITLLLIHAQDHFMSAMTVIDLATEIVEIYKTR